MEIKNRKAFHNYTIEDKFETGIVLQGNEVKSIRLGQANIKDSYARFKKGELYLVNMNINPYKFEGKFTPNPTRERKLLLKKSELRKLLGMVNRHGATLIPLKVYLKNDHLVKIKIGVATGKKQHEKKESKKRKDIEREIEKEHKLKLQ